MISVGERHWLLLEKCPGFKSAILLENSVAKVCFNMLNFVRTINQTKMEVIDAGFVNDDTCRSLICFPDTVYFLC